MSGQGWGDILDNERIIEKMDELERYLRELEEYLPEDEEEIRTVILSLAPACRERKDFEDEEVSERILNTLRCLKNGDE